MNETAPHLPRWQSWLLRPLAWLIILWGKSLRVHFRAKELEALKKLSTPVVFVFWHNHLLSVVMTRSSFCRTIPLTAMVSPSRDGSLLSTLFSHLGFSSVRGSSFGRGTEAIRDAIRDVREGKDLAIAPDGSRGPIYQFKPGALLVCRRTQRPAVFVGGHFHRAWRFRSWDGLFLPLPFSRVEYRLRIIENPADLPRLTREDEKEFFQQLLLELCGEKTPPPGLPVKVQTIANE